MNNSFADYVDINIYNSMIHPSTVHVKDTALFNFYARYLMQKVFSVFDFELPPTWDLDFFRYWLFGYGSVCVFDTPRFGCVALNATYGGFNLYYKPLYAIVANPLLETGKELTIGTECAIVKINSDWCGVVDLVSHYADMMALASQSISINLLNSHVSTLFYSENKAHAESLKKLYDQIASGQPAVFFDKQLLDDDGNLSVTTLFNNVKNTYIADDIITDLRRIECEFDTKIGIPNSNTEKRERLVTGEVNAQQYETACLAEMWEKSIEQCFAECRRMFNVNPTVRYKFKDYYREGGETDAAISQRII